MSETKSSGNLSKGDVISFVALLIMGVLVFFGMNFMTMGDRVPSIVVAILTVVLMTVFVFLAAFAKAQDRNQAKWKKVEYAMLVLYVLCLIPCYIFCAKFFDVQFDKENVMKEVTAETASIDKMFNDYGRKSESRVSAYQIELESMFSSEEGRARIAEILETNPNSVTQESVNQAVSSFSKSLKGGEYKTLEAEKNNMIKEAENNFNNWNIMFIPQYAQELGSAKEKYAQELERIYNNSQNSIERNVPEFSAESYSSESGIIDTFKSANGFSIVGLLVVLFLGFLGLVKYLLGNKSTVIPMEMGASSSIAEDGGISF